MIENVKYLMGILLLCAVLASCSLVVSGQNPHSVPLTKGWDSTDQRLGAESKVTWQVTPPNQLNVTFMLAGAEPSHMYQVGVYLFDKDNLMQSPNITKFYGTQIQGERCPSREGNQACPVAFDFGNLTTDGLGNGQITFTSTPPASTYYAQFTVRSGNCAPPNATTGCAVVYRTGGRYASEFERIIIPG